MCQSGDDNGAMETKQWASSSTGTRADDRTHPARTWQYVAVLLVATFLMASSFVAGKILLRSVPPFPLLGARFLLAAVATLPLAYFASRSRASSARSASLPTSATSLLAVLCIGLLQTAAVLGLTFLALRSISAGEASILLFTNPIWVAALAPLVLAERLSMARVAGLFLGIVGVALAMGAPHGLSGIQGDILVLLASLAWAVSTIITKRLHVTMNPWWLNFWQMLVGALILVGIAVLLRQSWPARLSISDWAWFVWLAIPGSTLSFGLWFTALRWGGAATTSSYLFLVPLFSVLLAFVILGEHITMVQIIGGVLVGAALYLVNNRRGSGNASIGTDKVTEVAEQAG